SSMWQRPLVGQAAARRGNLCWVNTWLFFGEWRPCPRPAAVRTVRTTRRVVQAPAVATCTARESDKQYWATGLSRAVDSGLLQGLQDAVARGEVGWLDVNPEFPV